MPRPNHLAACLGTMVRMMLADEKVLDAEVARIIELYPQVGGGRLSEADVRSEIEVARADPRELTAVLSEMAGRLNPQGKLAVIRVAFAVATADGHLDVRERALLGDLARALGVDDPLAPRDG